MIYAMHCYVCKNFPDLDVLVDIQDQPGQGIPDQIGKFRPDLYAQSRDGGRIVVGEAKSAQDLSSARSFRQIECFLAYCGKRSDAIFMLAVPYQAEASAKTIIHLICREHGIVSDDILLYDECDWWRRSDNLEYLQWRLISE